MRYEMHADISRTYIDIANLREVPGVYDTTIATECLFNRSMLFTKITSEGPIKVLAVKTTNLSLNYK